MNGRPRQIALSQGNVCRKAVGGNPRKPAIRVPLLFLLGLLAIGLRAETDSETVPSVTFTKEFPNSQPEYYSITVRKNGAVVYRTTPNDESPVEFRLSPDSTQEIFALARKLNLFRDANLESNRRVAFMGKKTLAFQNGPERYSTPFNYTLDPNALALVSLFERIFQTQNHFVRLQYLVRFDRLGVVKELLQLEINLDQGRLLEPTQLIPLLEKIRDDRALIQVAQGRAAQIIAKLKSGKD